MNSTKLAELKASIAPEIERDLKELDKFSEDMIELERLLMQMAVFAKFDFTYIFNKTREISNDLHNVYIRGKEYSISWAYHPPAKKKRIIYSVYDYSYLDDEEPQIDRKLIDSKALIECPSKIRLECKDHLEKFFERFVYHYNNSRSEINHIKEYASVFRDDLLEY